MNAEVCILFENLWCCIQIRQQSRVLDTKDKFNSDISTSKACTNDASFPEALQ